MLVGLLGAATGARGEGRPSDRGGQGKQTGNTAWAKAGILAAAGAEGQPAAQAAPSHAGPGEHAEHGADQAAGTRCVLQGDAFAWLATQATLGARTCVVTSLPDRTELRAPSAGKASMEPTQYAQWLSYTTQELVSKLEAGCAAFFYQTDIRSDGVYVDKSFWVSDGARRAGANMLFHKIALRSRPGVATTGINPGFTHLLCYGSPRGCPLPHPMAGAVPDVLARGKSDWMRGTGPVAAAAAVRYLQTALCCDGVVDPFCGTGAILAVAEAMGCRRVLGVELNSKRAKLARTLRAVPQPAGAFVLVRPGDVARYRAVGQHAARTVSTIGRNAPCPCLSGLKFKACCEEGMLKKQRRDR